VPRREQQANVRQLGYQFWRQNPNHPSWRFKRLHSREPLYTVRIGHGGRVLRRREGGGDSDITSLPD